MNAIGAASSSGHGVATTSTATARTGLSPGPTRHRAREGQWDEQHGKTVGRAHEEGADAACACSTRRTSPA